MARFKFEVIWLVFSLGLAGTIVLIWGQDLASSESVLLTLSLSSLTWGLGNVQVVRRLVNWEGLSRVQERQLAEVVTAPVLARLEKMAVANALFTEDGNFESWVRRLQEPMEGRGKWLLASSISQAIGRAFRDTSKIVIPRVSFFDHGGMFDDLLSRSRGVVTTVVDSPQQWFEALLVGSTERWETVEYPGGFNCNVRPWMDDVLREFHEEVIGRVFGANTGFAREDLIDRFPPSYAKVARRTDLDPRRRFFLLTGGEWNRLVGSKGDQRLSEAFFLRFFLPLCGDKNVETWFVETDRMLFGLRRVGPRPGVEYTSDVRDGIVRANSVITSRTWSTIEGLLGTDLNIFDEMLLQVYREREQEELSDAAGTVLNDVEFYFDRRSDQDRVVEGVCHILDTVRIIGRDYKNRREEFGVYTLPEIWRMLVEGREPAGASRPFDGWIEERFGR